MYIEFIKVIQHINEYFKDKLPQYTIMEIRRQSYHPEDNYLYMVAAKNENGTYTIWTSWNETTQSLNHGHYNLPSMESCVKIMSNHQAIGNILSTNNITPQDSLHKLLIKNNANFENSCDELLYIMGYIDGISAQQVNNWNLLTETQINAMFAKALKD